MSRGEEKTGMFRFSEEQFGRIARGLVAAGVTIVPCPDARARLSQIIGSQIVYDMEDAGEIPADSATLYARGMAEAVGAYINAVIERGVVAASRARFLRSTSSTSRSAPSSKASRTVLSGHRSNLFCGPSTFTPFRKRGIFNT